MAAPAASAAFWHGLLNLTSKLVKLVLVQSARTVTGMSVRRYGVLFLAALLISCGLSRDSGWAEQASAGGQIFATYNVDLVGFSLGEFHLAIAFHGLQYEIEGNGQFSLLLGGLYRGGGIAASTGKLTKAGPLPSTFTLRYEGGGKKEQRDMSFAGGAVSQVSILPQKKQSRRRVPVSKEQLVDVLDPLSAAFLHTRPNSPVCDDTLPVFDGRLRFNIVLTPKRADSVPKNAPTNLSGPAAVCKAKFVPIAGHKPNNSGIKFMAETDQIEVWLASLPGTSMYVPYWIGVPTPLGRGSMTLTEIKITGSEPTSGLRP